MTVHENWTATILKHTYTHDQWKINVKRQWQRLMHMHKTYEKQNKNQINNAANKINAIKNNEFMKCGFKGQKENPYT